MGVVAVGVLTAGVLAAVFGVIPFAQDNGAKQDLAAINTAQGVQMATAGSYEDKEGLQNAGTLGALPAMMTISVLMGGEGYCASVISTTGKSFYVSSEDSNPREGACPGGSPAPTVIDYAKPAEWTTQDGLGVGQWQAVATSDDGRRLVAGQIGGGYIYTSTDAGGSWTRKDSAGNNNWATIDSSADGLTLVAGTYSNAGGGRIHVSRDGGLSWAVKRPDGVGGPTSWKSLSLSSDGSVILAAPDRTSGYLYLSKDFGENWTKLTSSPLGASNWKSVSMSEDGVLLFAGAANGQVFTSADSGASWTMRAQAFPGLASVASSATGRTLIVGTNTFLYTSADAGESWAKQNVPSAMWQAVATSADGTKLIAVQGRETGSVYTSADSGETWTAQIAAKKGNWTSAGISRDGSQFIGGQLGGNVLVGRYGS